MNTENPLQRMSQVVLDACERMESAANYTRDIETREALKACAKMTMEEMTAILISLPWNQPQGGAS